MIGRMNRGEDIEHYADKHEERQEVLRNLHDDETSDSGGFIEEDERESRKTVAQQQNIY
jgi:hypothetical protein